MYVEGQRIRPRTYRFVIPEGVEHDEVLFIVSGVQAALTPRDYARTAVSNTVDVELVKDVTSAVGAISFYAFFSKPIPKKSGRGQPPRK